MADQLEAACQALARGGVVAYPTEGVFGLGCDPHDTAAVHRILALKERPAHKGLILIADRADALVEWLGPIDAPTWRRVTATWPGPVTWLMPAAATTPRAVRGDHDTLAVRVTAHATAAALCRTWGGPLISTSANLAGGEPARSEVKVSAIFGDAVDVVVDAPVGGHQAPTPIRDARTGETLRS
jgi:L-threonylcarbamoyladenylate synthase